MKGKKEIEKIFSEISEKIESINRAVEDVLPFATFRKTSTFGNSAHIVLSKDHLDKDVGVIVLDNFYKNKKEVKK